MPSARSSLLCVAAAAALLAGCGGGDGAEAEIEEVVVASGKSDNPADCERLYTQHFLERVSSLEGEAALAVCEAETGAPDNEPAETVVVTGIDVDGGAARADAAYVGSDLDGQQLTIALVEEDGRWKLDELVAFVRFDRERMLEAMTEDLVGLAEESGEAELAACMLAWFEALAEEELEARLLAPDRAELQGVAEDCLRRTGADQSA